MEPSGKSFFCAFSKRRTVCGQTDDRSLSGDHGPRVTASGAFRHTCEKTQEQLISRQNFLKSKWKSASKEWTHGLLGETDPEADLESFLGERDLNIFREKHGREIQGKRARMITIFLFLELKLCQVPQSGRSGKLKDDLDEDAAQHWLARRYVDDFGRPRHELFSLIAEHGVSWVEFNETSS